MGRKIRKEARLLGDSSHLILVRIDKKKREIEGELG